METWKILAASGVVLALIAERLSGHLLDTGRMIPAFYVLKIMMFVIVAIMWLAIWKKP